MFDALAEYVERFNDGFPTMEIPNSSDDEIIEMIQKCINAGKNAYEMGFAKRDGNLR